MNSFLSKIGSALKRRFKNRPISDWYHVTFDDHMVYRNVSAPGREPWSDKFSWKDIERVCFECTDYMYPDNIYFYVQSRPESYLIPSEARGADDLWEFVLDNGLFDPELAVEAMGSVSGLFCHTIEK